MGKGYRQSVSHLPYRSSHSVLRRSRSGTERESLTIKNLKVDMDPSVYEPGDFQLGLSRLKQLHQLIDSETAIIEYDLWSSIHKGFTRDIPVKWFKPVNMQRTYLTIYALELYQGF